MEFTKRQAEIPRIWDIQLNPDCRTANMEIEEAANSSASPRQLLTSWPVGPNYAAGGRDGDT